MYLQEGGFKWQYAQNVKSIKPIGKYARAMAGSTATVTFIRSMTAFNLYAIPAGVIIVPNGRLIGKPKGRGKMAKYFEPGPRCGNCHFFSMKKDNYHPGRFCRLEADPRECGSKFQSRSGRPRKVRKVKPWQINGQGRRKNAL